jgi:hypothetical protein
MQNQRFRREDGRNSGKIVAKLKHDCGGVGQRSVNQFHGEMARIIARRIGRQEATVPVTPSPRSLAFIPSPPLVPDQRPPADVARRG